jgi:hypothetical protein
LHSFVSLFPFISLPHLSLFSHMTTPIFLSFILSFTLFCLSIFPFHIPSPIFLSFLIIPMPFSLFFTLYSYNIFLSQPPLSFLLCFSILFWQPLIFLSFYFIFHSFVYLPYLFPLPPYISLFCF